MRSPLAFVAIILAYAGTRWLALRQAGSLWFDEAFSAHFSSLPLSPMWQFLQFEHNPLLHFFLLKGWMLAFGGSDLAVRLLSVLFGALTVAVIYAAGRRLYDERAGLFASILVIASTLMLYHQTEARMYALEALLVALLIWLSWEIRQRVTVSIGLVIGYGVAGAMLAHTHVTAWAFLVALTVYWCAEWLAGGIDTRRFKSLVFAQAAIIVSILPWLIVVARNKAAVGTIAQGWFFAQSADGYFLSHLTNMLVSGESAMTIRVAASALLLVLLGVAVFSLAKPDWWQKIRGLFERDAWPVQLITKLTPANRFLLTLVLVQALMGFALQITVTKYLLGLVIPLFLLAASGWSSLSSARLRLLALTALITLTAPMHVRLYTTTRHHWDEVARQVTLLQQQNPEALVLVHSFANALLLQRYQSPTAGSTATPFYPLEDTLSLDERIVRYNWQSLVNEKNVAVLDQNTSSYDTIILVSSTAGSGEQDPVKKRLWQQGWTLEQVLSYKGYGDPEILILRRVR